MPRIARPRVVGIAVGEGAVAVVVAAAEQFVGGDRIAAAAGRAAGLDEFPEGLQRRHAKLGCDDALPLGEGLRAFVDAQGVPVHQAVQLQAGEGHQPAPRQGDELLPGLGDALAVARQHVRPRGADWRCRVGGQRPGMARMGVARMGLSHRMAGLVLEEGCGHMGIQWQEQAMRRGLPDRGMVDHQQVVAARQRLDGLVGEGLQGTQLPLDADPGMQFAVALRGGHHRDESAGVAPGDAPQGDGRIQAKTPGSDFDGKSIIYW